MKCRITKKRCKDVLDFGKMPLGNGFVNKRNFFKEEVFNLKVGFNEKLSLFQIAENPNPKRIFNKNYPFFTSKSKLMIKHFQKFSDWVKKYYISKNSNILEIGSNDGVFLDNFKNINHVGFEPSKNVHQVAKKRGLNSINKFFNKKNIKYLINKKIKFDLIYGANVFCHIPDQIDLIQSMDKLLSQNGTIIFEEPYLGKMYEKVSYDQIYDEHIFMFSASSIKKLYDKFGFQLVDCIPQKVHGGSMRYIIKKKNKFNISKRLKKILKYEKKQKIDNFKGCLKFKKKVEESKKRLIKKLYYLKSKNHKICGYGATSKSTTILNYCNIDNKIIDCIFDVTPEKIGRYTPITHIPILNYKLFKKLKYKYVFLFAWNHKKEILEKEKRNGNKNIKWITHL